LSHPHHRSPRQRRRARAGSRGSLIVETLVVVPLLIVLCGIGWWFYEVRTAQMKVYRDAREPTFATATFGCGRAGDTSHPMPGPQPGVAVSGGSAPTVPADFSSVTRNVPGNPNNAVITRPIGEAKGSGTDTVAGFRAIWFTPRTTSYQASATMMCNEAVEDGQLDLAKRSAAVTFSP